MRWTPSLCEYPEDCSSKTHENIPANFKLTKSNIESKNQRLIHEYGFTDSLFFIHCLTFTCSWSMSFILAILLLVIIMSSDFTNIFLLSYSIYTIWKLFILFFIISLPLLVPFQPIKGEPLFSLLFRCFTTD